MSLKAFHVVFIFVSILLSYGFGAWGLRDYQVIPNNLILGLAILSILGGAGLTLYLFRFLNKWRDVSYLGLLLFLGFSSNQALACATCFGNPDSSMAKSAIVGVWVLMGFIGVLLIGFAALFLFWIKRAKAIQSTS